MIESAQALVISAATIWEISIKVRLGTLKGDVDEFSGEIQNNGFKELPVYARHARQVARLALLHSRSLGRLLIARFIAEELRLVTANGHLAAYSESVIEV